MLRFALQIRHCGIVFQIAKGHPALNSTSPPFRASLSAKRDKLVALVGRSNFFRPQPRSFRCLQLPRVR